jgi:enoyl-[acyl-carrier-protein] reductase (NADH)
VTGRLIVTARIERIKCTVIVIAQAAGRSATDVEDVADAVEFLMGDKAKSITGTVLTLDAGSTA